MTRADAKEIVIYTIFTLCGLAVDFGLANLLVYFASLPLIVAGTCGLIAGTITNYFVHLKVTFRHKALSVSWTGFWKYVQTCLAGAAVRIVVLAVCSLFPSLAPFYALVIATGLSFITNYLLARFYAFR